MGRSDWKKHAWIKAGAIGSLAIVLLSMFRGHRLLGKLATGFAGAFLVKWDEIRLENKVSRLLAKAGEGAAQPLKAGAESGRAADDLARQWGKT